MVAKVKKNSVKVLFILLGVVGLALITNSRNSHQENTNVLALCSGCPPTGLEDKPPRPPKCPCLTPKLPKG